MSDIDHQLKVNDLRMRVLEGIDIPAHEMLLIVNDIRRGRRTAARISADGAAARSSKGRKGSSKTVEVPMTKENLLAILDEEQS